MNKGKKKGTYINQELLIKTVAERTSCTQPQVKQVINVMFELIELFTLHPDCSQVFEFKVGNIGKITLKPRTGRKVGTYKRPNNFTSEIIVEEVTEEEPSYQELCFEMFPSYKENLRKAGEQRSQKQKWIDKYGVSHVGWKARNRNYYPLDSEV